MIPYDYAKSKGHFPIKTRIITAFWAFNLNNNNHVYYQEKEKTRKPALLLAFKERVKICKNKNNIILENPHNY